MTAITGAPTRLGPVTVDCTRCGHQWPSRARRHVVIRCPDCGHGVRVKRDSAGPSSRGTSHHQAPGRRAAAAEPPPAAASEEDDDEGPTYIYDEHHRLVLAEWTEDGYLVAAQPRMNHAAELAARGYVIGQDTPAGTCPIASTQGINPGRCAGGAFREFGPHRVCERHHRALTTPLPPRPR